MCALVSFLLLMSSHTSFTSVSQLHAQIFIFFLHRQREEEEDRKGSARLWFLYRERAFQHKRRIHSAAHLPSSPSVYNPFSSRLHRSRRGGREGRARGEREKREGRRGQSEREDAGREKSRAEGKPKKKKNYQRDGAGGGEVGNENETDGGQSRGGK